jgi:hypothetical protein
VEPCQGGNRGFNPVTRAGNAGARAGVTVSGQVAQLAEHAAENRGVGSSILPLATRSRLGRDHQFKVSWPRTSAHRLMTDWYSSAERGNSSDERAFSAAWMSRAE